MLSGPAGPYEVMVQNQRAARTIQRIELELKDFFHALPERSTLFLGVSGGVDSVVLATLLARLKAQGELAKIKTISVVHVNHRLRGKESGQDARFVKAFARRLGVAFHGHSLRWKKGEKKDQDTCRTKRFSLFSQHVGTGAKNFLVLAHHEDDQAETVFLRLLRGTGLKGLGGMKARERFLLRPLLHTPRAEIELVAKALGLTWREDSSNKSTKYERNWLRREVMPLLEAKRPGFARRLAALAREVGDADGESVKRKDEPQEKEGRSSLLPLKTAQALGRTELHTRFQLSRTHTDRLYQFLKEGKPSRLSLPRKKEACIAKGWFWVG